MCACNKNVSRSGAMPSSPLSSDSRLGRLSLSSQTSSFFIGAAMSTRSCRPVCSPMTRPQTPLSSSIPFCNSSAANSCHGNLLEPLVNFVKWAKNVVVSPLPEINSPLSSCGDDCEGIARADVFSDVA
jgi:hypothetical protein